MNAVFPGSTDARPRIGIPIVDGDALQRTLNCCNAGGPAATPSPSCPTWAPSSWPAAMPASCWMPKPSGRQRKVCWISGRTCSCARGIEPQEAMLANFDPGRAPELRPEQCPYRGLDAFRAADRVLFFGRQRLLGQLRGPPGAEPSVGRRRRLRQRQVIARAGRIAAGAASGRRWPEARAGAICRR